MRQTLWVGFGSCVKATVGYSPVQPLATLVSRGICCRIWPHFWWRWWGRPPNSLRLVVGLASLVWLFGKRSFLWEHWKFSPDKRRISVGFLLACVPVWHDRRQWDCHLRLWQILLLTEVWSWSMFSVQQLTLNDGLLKLTSLQPHHVDKVQIGKCRCVVPVIRDSAFVNYPIQVQRWCPCFFHQYTPESFEHDICVGKNLLCQLCHSGLLSWINNDFLLLNEVVADDAGASCLGVAVAVVCHFVCLKWRILCVLT